MSNVNESPNHFIVLDAVSRGVKNVDKLSRVTKINNKAEVELIVNDLISQRLIITIEKKGLLGRKKIELGITDTGQRLLDSKKAELEKQQERMQQLYNDGDTEQLQSYMDSNRLWMPMMLFSGIMDMMFFMSMMSMMGMALSPLETGLVGGAATDWTDYGSAAANDNDGGSGSSSGGDAGAGHTDSGGFDMGGNFGGGDISF